MSIKMTAMFSILFCAASAGAADAPAKTSARPAAPEKAKAEASVNCSDAQSIRNFKDVAMGKLVGTEESGRHTAAEWARCLCGKAADAAGLNAPLPPNPTGVPAMPSCRKDQPRQECMTTAAKEYFGVYLPVSKKQAAKLGRCAWLQMDVVVTKQPIMEKSK